MAQYDNAAQRGSLVRGISAELQDEVLATLIFDKEMYDCTKGVIIDNFFLGNEYIILFKALKQFHDKNSSIPTLKDMMIEISLLISTSDSLDKAKKLLKILYTDYTEEYIFKESAVKKTHFEEFIKRNGAEYCFSTMIEQSRNDEGIDWGRIIPHFKKFTDFSIVQSTPYNMGDIENIRKVHEEALGGNGSKKIRFFLDEVNELMNHDAFLPGTLNMISASPGVGKTLSMINQGVSATKDGFNSLHIFLGDLSKEAARLRYLSNYSQISLGKLIKMPIEEHEELSRKLNDEGDTAGALSRNFILPINAGRCSIEQLGNEIEKSQLKEKLHFDQIIIDYDSNLKTEGMNMYNEGGDVYNKAREFMIKNQSVGFILSQPKITFFSQEILTLDCASESSQKQHVVDFMMGIGKPGKILLPAGVAYVSKNRDGRVGKKIYLSINGATQTVKSISENEYERLKRDAINED